MDIAALLALREGTTPGPWWVCEYDAGDCSYYDHNGPCPSIQAPEEQDCAIVHWDGFKQEYWSAANGNQRQIDANARLIAAAPDLLDAIAATQADNTAMLDAIAALQAENAALRAQVDEAVAGAVAQMREALQKLGRFPGPVWIALDEVTTDGAADALARRDAETREKLARLVTVSKRYSDENDRYDEDNKEAMKSWRDARLALIAALAEIEGSHA